MRRKPNTLLPIEQSILEAAQRLQKQGFQEFHGFQIAKELGSSKRNLLGAYSTLYRALKRLEGMGKITSRWEEQIADGEHRPRRRYYRLKCKSPYWDTGSKRSRGKWPEKSAWNEGCLA